MKSNELLEDAPIVAPSEGVQGQARPESTFRDAILGAGSSLPGMIALSGQSGISTGQSHGRGIPDVVSHSDSHLDHSRDDGTHSNSHVNDT
jgi:hypothetical protein